MWNDVALGDVGSEIDVEGNGSVSSLAPLFAEDCKCTRVMRPARDDVADRNREQLSAVQVEQANDLPRHVAEVSARRHPALVEDTDLGNWRQPRRCAAKRSR